MVMSAMILQLSQELPGGRTFTSPKWMPYVYYTGNLYLDNFRVGDGNEPFTVMSHLLLLTQTEQLFGEMLTRFLGGFFCFFLIDLIGFVIIAQKVRKWFISAPNLSSNHPDAVG